MIAEPRTLIDDLLAEQQRLTVVERFARKHERGQLPVQTRHYRDLIPIEKPRAGEQYAFAVDLDACTGCKACVSACHSLNGLDDDEIWRNVGMIHGGTVAEPYQQTVTTACHHCVDPACLNGCPVMAYEKDAATGIVRHLDDQCIGCQYCILKCPYDVPKYSKKRGIVRKCDMCYSRLVADEAPACAQACPNSAITIRTVSKKDVVALTKPEDRLLPGAFTSDYTKPTTTFETRKPPPVNARPGDAHRLHLQHAHWPLIWMLVLTQLAAGMFVNLSTAAFITPDAFAQIKALTSVVASMVLALGLGISVLHLGRPLGAWRAFLGLRTSWMSREIAAFGILTPIAVAFTGACWSPRFSNCTVPLGWITALLAIIGIFCSAMIYIDTRRAFWNAGMTFTRFFGTSALLGTAALAAVLGWSGQDVRMLMAITTIIGLALATCEIIAGMRGFREGSRSSLTLWRLLRPLVIARAIVIAAATLAGMAAICGGGVASAVWATIFLLLSFSSQMIERYCFFTAVDAPRMPGGIAV
jgi:formate dehydrogenase iron-sulfur subunit